MDQNEENTHFTSKYPLEIIPVDPIIEKELLKGFRGNL